MSKRKKTLFLDDFVTDVLYKRERQEPYCPFTRYAHVPDIFCTDSWSERCYRCRMSKEAFQCYREE